MNCISGRPKPWTFECLLSQKNVRAVELLMKSQDLWASYNGGSRRDLCLGHCVFAKGQRECW